jgi:hypothetical protein
MTVFARTLDRQLPARSASLIPGLIATLLAAFLWSGAARADLDDIRRAAEAGDVAAQLELGVLFQYGFNYKDNEIPALTWYTLSANQGNAKAAKLRDALKAKMTEKDVQEAMEQVAQYKPSGKPAAAPTPATAPPEAPVPEAPAPAAAPEAAVEFSPPPETEVKPVEVEPLPVPPATQ